MALLKDKLQKESLQWKSSFNSVAKINEEICNRLLMNERLKKLLYYNDPKALGMPRLTPAQSASLVGDSILFIPRLKIDPDVKPYIIMGLSGFVPTDDRTAFREVSLSVDVLCNFDSWSLGDFVLRPYAIAGEVDAVLNSTALNVGMATFQSAKPLLLNEYLGGVSLFYTLEIAGEDLKNTEVQTSSFKGDVNELFR